MPRRKVLAAVALALVPAAAPAQDLVSFDTSSFGKVVLSDKQSGGGGGDIQLELSVGDYKNEFIANYAPTSIFAQVGRSVGRLDVLTDTRTFPCTAFLVEGNRLLTNYHCVPGVIEQDGVDATSIFAVQFVAGYVREGVTEGTRLFHVNPVPVEASKDLDYAVLQVLGDAEKEFGALKLVAVEPTDNAPYWVIGHPLGEAQRISREQCRANAPALSDNRLLHTCDTLPGNSGSPVIDATLRAVVGLHHAGSRRSSVNYAIPMTAILANSHVLKASALEEDRALIDTGAPDRALSDALFLEDPAARRTALQAIVADHPGTVAADRARAFLDRMGSQSAEEEASALLLSALLLPDLEQQAGALRDIAARHPGTSAAGRATELLARLEAQIEAARLAAATPPATPAATTPDHVPPPAATTTPESAATEDLAAPPAQPVPHPLPPGTRIWMDDVVAVRAAPRRTARLVDLRSGNFIVTAHVGNRWYRLRSMDEVYIRIAPDADFFVVPGMGRTLADKIKAGAEATATPPAQPDGAAPEVDPGKLRGGTRIVIESRIPVRSAARVSSRLIETRSGSLVLARNLGDGWYRLGGGVSGFVRLTETTEFRVVP